MRVPARPKLFLTLVSLMLAMTVALSLSFLGSRAPTAQALPALQHHAMNCAVAATSQFCAEVYDSEYYSPS